MILPIRSRVWFDEDGAVAGTERWARAARGGGQPRRRPRHGRLRRLRAVQLAGRPRRPPRAGAPGAAATRRAPSLPTPPCPDRNPHPSSRPEDGEETPTTPGETLTPTQPVPAEEPTRRGGAARRLRRGVAGAVQAARGRDPGADAALRRHRRLRVDPQRPHPLRPGGRARRRGDGRPDAAVPADRGAGERPAQPRGRRRHATGHDDPAGGQRLRHPADQPDLRRPAARARGGGHEHRRGGGRSRPDGVQRPPRAAAAAAQRGGPAPRGGRHRAARRHPADGVARRGRRVVLHRPRAVVARPGPPRGHRRPHAQGRPGREPHLHRRRHRRGARSARPSPRPTAPARPPRCWSRWSSR